MIIPNWKDVAKKAWSVKLMLVAAVLSGLEAVLPFFSFLPDWSFATLTFFVVIGAMVARFVAQKGLS